ncbi:hypothetical protein HMPREF1177_01342 [Eikenella corrodens CC92I]|uniref:Uncharacterized protein n=1 Tax=Eikenella corrodens CC92I TaxID=1073362 RepID=V7IBR4_EIKCO|nr:hypothetical protein HMPREF1177_02118 [Eikenella corrodens CC92I]ETA83426.1 hypothetical protein HMPREF1177_01342 [Eikenella corrodens CC92I]
MWDITHIFKYIKYISIYQIKKIIWQFVSRCIHKNNLKPFLKFIRGNCPFKKAGYSKP